MKVETFNGWKEDEYPVRFWIGSKKYEVIEVEDRWYSPEISYFKVFVDDAGHYILKHDVNIDQWEAEKLR